MHSARSEKNRARTLVREMMSLEEMGSGAIKMAMGCFSCGLEFLTWDVTPLWQNGLTERKEIFISSAWERPGQRASSDDTWLDGNRKGGGNLD